MACYKLPVVDPETYKAAEKDLDDARKSLKKAQKAYDTLSTDYNKLRFHPYILSFLDSMQYRGTTWNSKNAEDRALHEATQGGRDFKNAVDNSERKRKMDEAKAALDQAQAAYDKALKKFNSYQPETRHIKLGFGCGNPDHTVRACEFNNPLLWSPIDRALYLLNHNKIQASCRSFIIINGIKVYCSITSFISVKTTNMYTQHLHLIVTVVAAAVAVAVTTN